MPLVFIAALFIHEIGHLIAAKAAGARVLSVKASALGFVIKYDMLSVSPIRESLICSAGSILGILSAVIVFATGLTEYDLGIDYILTSSILSFMNLLPVLGLDGGEILLCILESFTLPDRAYRISRAVSGSVAILFWILTVRIQIRHGINMSMLVMSVYFLYRSMFVQRI